MFYPSELLFNEKQFIKKKITIFDWFGLGGSSVIIYKPIISLGLPRIICRSLTHFLFLLRHFFWQDITDAKPERMIDMPPLSPEIDIKGRVQ